MYVKILGGLLVIAGTTAYGYLKGKEYQQHVEELSYLRRLLWQLEGEIRYTKAPLSDVLHRVSRRIREPYAQWMHMLSKEMEKRGMSGLEELWRASVGKNLQQIHLSKEEREELGNFGKQMGYLDIRMQEEALSWYEKQLEERERTLEKELGQKRRVYAYLGVLGGIFLTIILS